MSDSTETTIKDGAARAPLTRFVPRGLKYYLLLWSLFFLICFGLGYPTLSRYQPRAVEGLSDTALYYQLVTGDPQSLGRSYMRDRVLVPFVAKPFYWFALAHLPSWDAAFFGLLVANSIFCAASACFIASIGQRISHDSGVALLGATLYLLNFAISNFQLAGMVDSAESCFMLALTWTLFQERWSLLPVWGIFGALARETFVPFALVFTLAWCLAEEQGRRARPLRFLWVGVMAFASIATLLILHSVMVGHFLWPVDMAAQNDAGGNYATAFVKSLLSPTLWYVFCWLLPLGIWRLKRLPRRWVIASISTGVLALLLGAYRDIAGNIARPLFTALGPMLSVSAAMLLTRSTRLDMLKGDRAESHST